VEPLGCSIHAVDRADIHMGDVVVVAGCGPLGLGMIAAARLRGPGLLVAVDARPGRLEVARACGADLTLDLTQVDAVAEVLARTDGYGCDVYIEASGAPAAVEQGLRMVRKLGTFVEFSVMREPVTVDWTIIGDTKELDVRGSHLSPHSYPIAIDMLHRGQFPVDRIVTHTLPLTAFHEGMDLVLRGDRSIKVQLRP
jgi:threonine dehydrogenase-like Zn-dependent dehydrogenase